MNSNIRCHPEFELLEQFQAGSLSTGLSTILAAHIELCMTCNNTVHTLEEKMGAELSAMKIIAPSEKFSHMVDAIISQPLSPGLCAEAEVSRLLPVQDQNIVLPHVLAKAASNGLIWKKLAGGINQARVVLDRDTQCDFLYMKPGGQIPMHKHQGYEITLVLDGSFKDDGGIYNRADFIARRGDQIHSPFSEDGCLCFAVLDRPLTFTSGMARLLNPVNRLLFKRA